MPFDKQKALDHIEFIQLLRHTGDFYGQPFTLLPWQHQILWDVYGTVDENGLRQYAYIYLEVPKKNGKTEMVAGIGIDHLYNDPPGGQIYCCAAEKDQASLVYLAAKQMIEQDEELEDELNVVDSKKMIVNRRTGTFLKVLSAEAYSKHGINPTVVIFDELHAQPNRDLWDVMTFGAGAARKEPIWWVITTAGDDPDRKSIGWEIHDKAQKIIDGEVEDPTWYAKIYGAPEEADIFDEKTWYGANPSLGVSISVEAVRKEALAARNSPASERLFRWLRLNQWIALKRISWLPITLWDSTERGWNPADMLGQRCYVGLDLSSTTDLTAAVCLFPPSDSHEDWRFITKAWIPEASMRERSQKDHVPYDKWVREGFLEATPGNVVDYGLVATAISAIDQRYKVQHFFSDPWRLEYLKQLLPLEIQAKFIEISQTMAGTSCGIQEAERMFMAGTITHAHDPVGRWSFGNARVSIDGNENKKLMKNKSIERIDPTVALINAMSGAIRMEPRRSVYETRGLRTVG